MLTTFWFKGCPTVLFRNSVCWGLSAHWGQSWAPALSERKTTRAAIKHRQLQRFRACQRDCILFFSCRAKVNVGRAACLDSHITKITTIDHTVDCGLRYSQVVTYQCQTCFEAAGYFGRTPLRCLPQMGILYLPNPDVKRNL